MMQLQKTVKRFDDFTALDAVDLEIPTGTAFGLLGSNGAGKSTILRLFSGIYQPEEGQVLIDGRDVRSIPNEELRSKFGVAFQNDFVMEGTIEDNIRFFRPIGDADIRTASEDAQRKGDEG